jgi:hypothetical protein
MPQEVSVTVKKGVETKSYEGVSSFIHNFEYPLIFYCVDLMGIIWGFDLIFYQSVVITVLVFVIFISTGSNAISY